MKILLITPKRKKVDLFFVGALLTETLVADLLPSKWRKIWLTGFINSLMLLLQILTIG